MGRNSTIPQEVFLNVIPDGSPIIVYANQYDVGRGFVFHLKEGLIDYNIDYQYSPSVEVNGRKPDNHVFLYTEADEWAPNKQVIDYFIDYAGNGAISVYTTEQMTAAAGDVLMQIVIKGEPLYPDKILGTLNIIMRVQEQPYASGDPSETEIPAIVAEATEQMERAEEAVRHYPYIDDTSKNWMLWDSENEEWVNTGVRAQGIDGSGSVNSVDGVVPDINGNVPLTWADMPSTSNLAVIEATRTMTAQRFAGSYVYVTADDTMYKITTTIAANGTLTPGTNATAAKVGDELASLNSDLTPKRFNVEVGTGYTETSSTKCQKMGSLVELRAELSFNNTTATSLIGVLTVPNDCKPTTAVALTCIDSTNDKALTAVLKNDGTVNVYRDNSTSFNVMKLHGMYFTS